MTNFLLVAAGGALGAVARYGVSVQAARLLGPERPWGTLLINVLGSLLMGLLAGRLALQSGSGEGVRLFLGVGLLGGFTTFSAFSLETVALLERREWATAALYVGGSVVLSVAALALGLALVRKAFA